MPVSIDTRVTAITRIFAQASSFPCEVTTEDGARWVVKFRGAGPGPMGLLTEYAALQLAAAMELPVPRTKPLYLDAEFPWTIGTDEFDGIVQRSGGWNLGIELIENSVTAAPGAIMAAGPDFLDALDDVDRLFCNMDRTSRNPNVLASPSGLVAIDFDACLFMRRVAQGHVPRSFPLPAGHLLEGRQRLRRSCPLRPELARTCLGSAPEEWIAASGMEIEPLSKALSMYISAWNWLQN